MPPLSSILRKPPKKNRELRNAIVRHGERADVSWESEWPFSKDAQVYPFDPPLTPGGMKQARECGERLRQLEPAGEGWDVAISSPFFRCVQTAVEICIATGASLIIDQDWGEVRFRELLDPDVMNPREGLTRTHQFLAAYVAQKGVKLRNADAPCGKVDTTAGPESCRDARDRYARKFAVCLDRAMLLESSFIVVSHGESLPGCLPLFPGYNNAEVVSVPFCGMLVGRLEQSLLPVKNTLAAVLESAEARPALNTSATYGVLDCLSVIEQTCELRGTIESSLLPKRSKLPAWMRKQRFHFRASYLLRKTRGVANSDSSTYADFRSLLPLSPLSATVGEPTSSRSDREDVAGKGYVFETCDEEPVQLPPDLNPFSLADCSIGDSTMLFGGSDKGTTFDERESSVEAAIDAGGTGSSLACSTPGSTLFELAGLLTDPTFKKIPSCRRGTGLSAMSKGQTCSPMGCARVGPFARLPSSQPAGGQVPNPCLAPRSSTAAAADSAGDSSKRTKKSLQLVLALPMKGNSASVTSAFERESPASLDQASAGVAKMIAAPPSLPELPTTNLLSTGNDSLDLSAIEANPLWKRRQLVGA